MKKNEKKLLEWFSQQMRKKIEANRHRGEFTAMDYRFCIGRMRQEIDELLFALFKYDIGTMDEKVLLVDDRQAIINECADVANFAMSLAANYFPAPESEASDE